MTVNARVRLTADPGDKKALEDEIGKGIGKAVRDAAAGGETGGIPAPNVGGSSANRAGGGRGRRGFAATATAAAAAAFGDRFASAEENIATGAGTAIGAGVEAATGSLLAGQAAQAAFSRLTAPGMEVMQRARESTLGRFEELAAQGFKINETEVRKIADYELERERRREKFRQSASGVFADAARDKGISPLGLDSNALSQVLALMGKGVASLDRLLGITNQSALAKNHGNAQHRD